MESFKFGGHRLHLYLSILFNLFLKVGYVPSAFSESAIIPLLKNRNGDITDTNNYRAIALSNSVSKVFEHLLYNFLYSEDDADMHQFGFKKKHSTTSCTYALKQAINYYRLNGSHVFACFVDFKKAFDYVDYWLLFCKLLDSNRSIECILSTRVLAY